MWRARRWRRRCESSTLLGRRFHRKRRGFFNERRLLERESLREAETGSGERGREDRRKGEDGGEELRERRLIRELEEEARER